MLLKPLPTSSAFDHPNLVILSWRRGILGLHLFQLLYNSATRMPARERILLSLQPVSTRLKHRIDYIRASPTSKLDDRALACWTVRFDSDSNVCGAAVLFFEFLPDLVVSERGKAEREIRYVLAVSTLLIQQGRKKLRIQVERQQIQQLPRLACLSLPKSGNINKN
jgi:hypothetical protein